MNLDFMKQKRNKENSKKKEIGNLNSGLNKKVDEIINKVRKRH